MTIYRIYDEQVNTHLYIHWNTYTQLPISLPLDLVNFIDYLMLEGIDLDILFDRWEDLQANGSTISNYKPHLSDELKFYLKQVAMRTEVLEWAKKNKNLVEKYENQVKLKPRKKAMINMLRYEHEFLKFRHVFALRGLDFTYQVLKRYLLAIKVDHPSFDLDAFMKTIISNPIMPQKATKLFQKLHHNYNFPLEAVPHIIRIKGDFDEVDKQNIYGLLEFQPSLDENFELIKTKSTTKDKIKILNSLCFQEDENKAEHFRAKIFKNQVFNLGELSVDKIDLILKTLAINADYFYMLKTSKSKFYLPALFESIIDVNGNLIVFKRFGVSHYDLYTKSGIFLESTSDDILIYKEGYYLIKHKSFATLKRFDENRKLKYVVFEKLEKKDYELETIANKQILLFDHVLYFYNESETSPNCFTNIRHLDEDYVAVCQNGLWGYAFSESSMEIAIDCQYAYAGPFIDDFAIVYYLKPKYKKRKGVWVDLYSWIPVQKKDAERKLNPYKFEIYHSSLKREHSLPVKLLDEVPHNVNYIEDYHYFGFSTQDISGLGRWLVIDRKGKIKFIAKPDESLELHEDGMLKVIGSHEIVNYDLNQEKPKKLKATKTIDKPVENQLSKGLTNDMDEVDQTKLSNPKYANRLLKLNPDFYEVLSNELKDNFEFALNTALYIDVVKVYFNSSERLQKDLNFIKQLLCISTHLFQHLPKKLKENEEIIEFALSKDISVAMCIKDTYPNRKNLIVQAIEKDASNFVKLEDSYKVNIEFISDLMKANPEVGKHLTSYHLDIRYLKELAEKIGPKISFYFPNQTSTELI